MIRACSYCMNSTDKMWSVTAPNKDEMLFCNMRCLGIWSFQMATKDDYRKDLETPK